MNLASSSTQYLLDATVAVTLQRAGHFSILADIAASVPIVFVEDVRDELVDVPAKHAANAAQVRETLAKKTITVVSIDVNDAAAARMTKLRKGKTSTSDVGETASIAWAADHADVIFVTNDATGAMRAIEELRGRTIGFYAFMAAIVEAGAIDVHAAEEIAGDCSAVPKTSLREPLWWRDWLASRA